METSLFTQYVKAELVVVAIALYFLGEMIKKSQSIKDKYIPGILGLAGILICIIWVLGNCPISTAPEICMAIFTAVIQGILVAGLSTYVDQLIKQYKKDE